MDTLQEKWRLGFTCSVLDHPLGVTETPPSQQPATIPVNSHQGSLRPVGMLCQWLRSHILNSHQWRCWQLQRRQGSPQGTGIPWKQLSTVLMYLLPRGNPLIYMVSQLIPLCSTPREATLLFISLCLVTLIGARVSHWLLLLDTCYIIDDCLIAWLTPQIRLSSLPTCRLWRTKSGTQSFGIHRSSVTTSRVRVQILNSNSSHEFRP